MSVASKDVMMKDGESVGAFNGDTSNTTTDDNPMEKPAQKKRKTGAFSLSGARLKDLSVAAQESISESGNHEMNLQCERPEMMNYHEGYSSGRSQRMPTTSLAPILLETTDPTKLPSPLRRLDPESKIEIFNRKTGRIMSGCDAIRVKDLPHALLMHAEYEPIIPTAVKEDEANSSPQKPSPKKSVARQGRSAPDVRVRRTVAPQRRRGNFMNKGRKVTVTKGPYRGHVGQIASQTPGGWYVLKSVRAKNDKDTFSLVVDPEHVEEVTTSRKKEKSIENDSTKTDDKSDDVMETFEKFLTAPNSELIETLRGRIEDLSKEESSLVQAIDDWRSREEIGQDIVVKEMSSRLSTLRVHKTSVQEKLHAVERQEHHNIAAEHKNWVHTALSREKANEFRKEEAVETDIDSAPGESTNL